MSVKSIVGARTINVDAVRTFRRLAATTSLEQGAQLRSATFDGSDYLVVPVIALIGNVILRPLNSLGPEFVPAEELSRVPDGWNGRPVLPDHPNEGFDSANVPRTLELYRFGHLFNTKFEDNKLKIEAYLSPERAVSIGSDATEVIERCRAGELVEVSVGAFVTLIEQSGLYNGQPYEYVWRNIVPDHLAMGLHGSPGACSVETGCGAPRAAKDSNNDNNNDNRTIIDLKSNIAPIAVEVNPMPKPNHAAGLGLKASSRPVGLARITDVIKSLTSSNEIRSRLASALTEVEPGLYWVEDYDAEESTVLYTTLIRYPDYSEDLLWWQRTWSIDDNDNVTVNDDAIQGHPKQVFQPIAASSELVVSADDRSESETTNNDCQCHKGASTMDKTKRTNILTRLLSRPSSPFQKADRKSLEALSDTALTDLDKRYAAPAPAPSTAPEEGEVEEGEEEKEEAGTVDKTKTKAAPSTVAPVATPGTVPAAPPATSTEQVAASAARTLSEDELLAAHPHLKAMVDGYKRAEEAKRSHLISALKSAQSTLTEAQLKQKPTEYLEEVARMLKIGEPAKDFSGQGYFTDNSTGTSLDAFMPPDSLGLDKGTN